MRKIDLHPFTILMFGFILYTVGNATAQVGRISDCTGEPYTYMFVLQVIFVVISLVGVGYLVGKFQNEI